MGDANAHVSLWNSDTSADSRGNAIADTLTESNLVVINKKEATRKPTKDETSSSSPDISLVSEDPAFTADWSTFTKKLSNHMPIIISIITKIAAGRWKAKCQANLRKADWEIFIETLEEQVKKLQEPATAEMEKNS